MIESKQRGAGKLPPRPHFTISYLSFLLLLLVFLTLFYSGPGLSAQETVEGKNIIFVLDISGSMKDKFAGVKTAFRTLIDNEAKVGDTIAIIAFDTTSRLVDSRTIRNDEDRVSLKDAVNSLSAIGEYTYIAGALKRAREEMERLSVDSPEKESRIIVLTDGKNEVPPSIPAPEVINLKEEAGKISEEAGWAIYYLVLVKKKPQTASSGEGSESQTGADGETTTGTGAGAESGEREIIPGVTAEEFPGGKILVVETDEGDIVSGLVTTVTEPLATAEGLEETPTGIQGRARELVAQYPVALPVGVVVVLAILAGLVFLGIRVIPGMAGAGGGGSRAGGMGQPKQVSFEIARGENEGEVYHHAMKPGDEITVGSGENCKVCLKGEKIAELAFKVIKTNGNYTLDPVSGVNVEINNSLVIVTSALKSGDKIHVGGCNLVFKVEET